MKNPSPDLLVKLSDWKLTTAAPRFGDGGSARRPIFCRLRTFKKTEGEAHARRDAA